MIATKSQFSTCFVNEMMTTKGCCSYFGNSRKRKKRNAI